MASVKSSFLDKVLGRIGRLDTEGLQSVVQRLARERGCSMRSAAISLAYREL